MSASPRIPNHIGQSRFAQLTNVEVGITAKASGVQADGYQLSAAISRVDTVGAGNDSVRLPKIVSKPGYLGADGASVGTILLLGNNAATNALKVYGGLTDTINAVASATGNAVAAGVNVILVATSLNASTLVGTWLMINSGTAAVAAITSGTINGAAIDNSIIGAATAAAGTFTALTATSAHLGTLNGTAIGSATAGAGSFTALVATSAHLTSLDATTVGQATAAAGSFTALVATSAHLTSLDATTVGAATAATGAFTDLTTTGSASIAGSAAANFGVHGVVTAQLTAITTALTTGVGTGLIGFATTAQLQETVDAVNACIAVLKKNGFTA